jgi:hypothetical protein
MPESVTDRCTKAHEYIFLLSKSPRYFYDAEAVKEPAIYAGDVRRGLGSTKEFNPDLQPTRNKRSVWEIATYSFPEAHFATFPPKLVEPCILAGTSERGCCPKCGAPWERIVAPDDKRAALTGKSQHDHSNDLQQGNRIVGAERKNDIGGYIIIGWQRTCKCNAGDPVPCTVMDPFSGAGTTGLVAQRLLRNYIGIELNPDYIAMSENRIVGDAPLFNQVSE